MNPGEARRRLLGQHEQLRRLLVGCETLAERLLGGDPVLTDFRDALAELRSAFAQHNEDEFALLAPVLHAADARGPQRVARMLEEHAGEHAALRELLAGDEPDVAARLKDFAEQVDAHMAAEERTFLSPAVLRDEPDGARSGGAR